ncbi:MAG: UDP-3-O-(3-hydroxymyristoyl)glucosamine N-acyltransferase [Phycisphaerae bacterium]|nr:UDP-3-O-(3-hydroxymyristoyl)glucosamine N-acyltransferase [Phycisphaerae bacterium]
MARISQLSEIHPSACIGEGVEIGPFCVVGPHVSIGAGCRLHSHVVLTGHVTMGAGNELYPYVVMGTAPQDLKYRGGPTRVEIGDGNTFREYVTVHPGTEAGGEITRVGSESLFMVGSHVAHDCLLADHVMLGNFCQLAGHVRMEEYSVVSALSGVHHFVTIGQYAFVGGLTAVKRDIPPFTIFYGSPGEVRGVNEVGMSRNGITPEQIKCVKSAYRRLFSGNNDQLRQLEQLEAEPNQERCVAILCSALRSSLDGKFGRHRESLRDAGEETWTPGRLGQTFEQARQIS